ncbi:hypothetical protein BM86_30695 [Bacillus thuringiensis]|uniref:DNA primase/nucleoside triphosphatase C-terminal domain-containing protein n=1 Tax=Bacillus thuringiensis TaxID=1428 RepID=A0A9W3SGA3_BACTU|nr:primase-like DNA-binding domain-containing protein [Bacillus thuringiensis]ANS50185.1 hypothetical protein BT246_48490 [Bacillus thuringiensis]MBH0339705.1 hypothetical protein [Bacillus thuringiensis]
MIGKFVEENLERDIKSFEVTNDLYKRYLKYCKTYNLKAISRTSFGYRLSQERIGAWHKSKGKAARWGVKLLTCKY